MPTANSHDYTNVDYSDFDFDRKCKQLTNARHQQNINHIPPVETESFMYSVDLDIAMDQLLIVFNNTGGQSWQ